MSWLRRGPHREQAEDPYDGTNEPAEQSLVDIIYQNQVSDSPDWRHLLKLADN